MLFLRFEAATNGHYTARLSAKNAQTGTIDQYEQAFAVAIPAGLFERVADFQAMRRRIGGPVRIGASPSALPTQTEAALTDLLYQTFFGGDIGGAVGQFMTLLQQRKLAELLLVISTDDDALLQLPWEMLLPRLGDNTTLPPDTFGLIRSHLPTLDAFNPQGQTDHAAPLKVLFVPALPENIPERSKQLEIEKEQRLIIEAVQGLGGPQQPGVVLDILDCANLREIEEALHKRVHDIVHISGHGTYLTDVQQGVLMMEDEDGNEAVVTGKAFGETLQRFSSVKLLVLSACETAAGEATGNLARQLAGFGLPAVLAMRFSVTDEAARLLAQQFYGELAAGHSLTKAMQQARHSLWQQTTTARNANPQAAIPAEWFTPVLFQNQGIGSLIDRQRTYDSHTHRLFYPPLTFARSQQTRLIGENFIGRKRILIQLRQGFRRREALCLHGMGGLGKTTTAEAFAHHYSTHHGNPPVLLFRKGNHAIEEVSILKRLVAVWAARTQPDPLVADDIEATIKSPDVPTLGKLEAVLTNCLVAYPMLLLFDNAEDVHDEAGRFERTDMRDFLRHLVSNVPNGSHVLFTTRYEITDLADCLTHLPLGKMTYAEQYRYIQSSEKLSRLAEAQQAILYTRFDGLPRAFEFLESILTNRVPFALDQLNRVESRLMENLLLGTLYDSLTDPEKTTLAQAAVLTGRAPVAALAYVLEQPEAALTPSLRVLAQKALCFGYDDALEIHPLTRAWLRQQGHLTPEQAKPLAHRAGQFYQGQPGWDNELPAKEYYEQAEAWDDYANAALGLAGQYQLTGFINEATIFTNDVLAKPLSPRQQANGLNRLGLLYDLQGDYSKAFTCYERSLSIRQQIGDKQGEGTTLNNMATLAHAQGGYDTALTYLQQSLSIQQQIGDKKSEGVTLGNLGQIYMAQSDYDTALTYLQQSLSIQQQIGDVAGMATTLHNMGTLAYKQQ